MTMTIDNQSDVLKTERPTMDAVSITPDPSEKAGRIKINSPRRTLHQNDAILSD